jgi:hypothetical protein
LSSWLFVVHAVFKYPSQSGTVCYAHGPGGYRGHAVNVVTQSGVCSGLGVGSETDRRLLSQTRTPLFQRANNARLPQHAADKGGGLASEVFPVVTFGRGGEGSECVSVRTVRLHSFSKPRCAIQTQLHHVLQHLGADLLGAPDS